MSIISIIFLYRTWKRLWNGQGSPENNIQWPNWCIQKLSRMFKIKCDIRCRTNLFPASSKRKSQVMPKQLPAYNALSKVIKLKSANKKCRVTRLKPECNEIQGHCYELYVFRKLLNNEASYLWNKTGIKKSINTKRVKLSRVWHVMVLNNVEL